MARPRTTAADYKKLLIRLPEELLDDYAACAEDLDRSLNTQIVRVLTQWMAHYKAERPLEADDRVLTLAGSAHADHL